MDVPARVAFLKGRPASAQLLIIHNCWAHSTAYQCHPASLSIRADVPVAMDKHCQSLTRDHRFRVRDTGITLSPRMFCTRILKTIAENSHRDWTGQWTHPCQLPGGKQQGMPTCAGHNLVFGTGRHACCNPPKMEGRSRYPSVRARALRPAGSPPAHRAWKKQAGGYRVMTCVLVRGPMYRAWLTRGGRLDG